MHALRITTAAALAGLVAAGGASAADAAAATIHVAVNGSDSAAGSAGAPLKTIQAAIDRAKPGTTIRVHKGTYSGELTIRTSGAPGAPITVTNAGDGPVTVTSQQPVESCGSRKPSAHRTISIPAGADYWTFSGLNLVHGAFIAGKGSGRTYSWHAGLAKRGVWEPRRKVPGMAKNDPAGARQAIPYLEKTLGADLDPADHIEFIDNTMTGRGVYATLAGYGVFRGNTVKDVLCGTGPGLWVMNFSHFWEVSGNDISDIAPSTAAHFMQEGIRFGTAASYNTITNNRVHDLRGDGRAFNTDVDASWNLFANNTATNVAFGYNDQMSGWGNVWKNNSVSGYRTYGFGFRMKDSVLTRPSKNSSTNMAVVTGNRTARPIGGDARALGVGAAMNSRFADNVFPSIFISDNALRYWGAEGNTWNGSPRPPASN